MSKYFKFFPTITYGDKVVTDITRRAKILEDIESNTYAYLPYTVKDMERPEDVALGYYGDPSLVWLVYYSNNIVDPYHEWPLDFTNFEKMIVKKHKAEAEKSMGTTLKDQEIINWTQNTTTNDNILYYYDSDNNRISKDTIINGAVALEGWTAMRIYDSEFLENENKREIRLMNKMYASQAVENLKKVINV
jgi:hypothetical protein